MAQPEDVCAPLADRLALGRVLLHADERGQELVATHADQRANACELHLMAVLGERIDPRPRVGVVAVDQRAVHVEDHSARHADERCRLRASDETRFSGLSPRAGWRFYTSRGARSPQTPTMHPARTAA